MMDSQMIDLSVVCHKYVFALQRYEIFYLHISNIFFLSICLH